MFNTYTNSLQWPIRSRNYQDYCTLLPERSESYQLSQSLSTSSRCYCASSRSSCCCLTPSFSSFVKPKASRKPGFVLYGIRKSTLIQWPSFGRRLLVCCEVYTSCDGTRRKNRSFRLRGLEESNECCDSRSFPDDVDAMISFLGEELIDEDRKWNLISRVEERKKVGNVGKVRVEGKDGYGKSCIPEMDAGQKPLPFLGRNLRPPVVKEPSESRPSMVSGSSCLREQVEQQQPLSAKSQEETGSILTDSSFIKRKLQRNKQVVRDSFEEWEEAYRVEAEMRTVDEIFMREALVEAKKAAATWEVPVGAVLVHDGKIIARGFNLVEKLRDSTAHAEMICIREGSKVLHSWRLADTTLYVTLEPCPMCAGAILQARVNTLVWGAPNKLLGADGSWIRLFPGGEGNGSENSEKQPPPVHPFHPKITIRRGVLESECAQTMQQFFQLRRKKKDKNSESSAPTDHHHHHHHLHPSKLLQKDASSLTLFLSVEAYIQCISVYICRTSFASDLFKTVYFLSMKRCHLLKSEDQVGSL